MKLVLEFVSLTGEKVRLIHYGKEDQLKEEVTQLIQEGKISEAEGAMIHSMNRVYQKRA
ncbi:MAG: hypothetical protein ACRDD8_11380 [Bacteroidales bacterium]